MRAVARKRLALPAPVAGSTMLASMLLVDFPREETSENRVRYAALTYAAWRATQTARNMGGVSEQMAGEIMHQYLHEAVRGHASSTRVLANSWADG